MSLPDYLIIGAQRCGTTSMMHYIADHPGVGHVPRREIKFFYQNWSKGLGWYESQFEDEPGVLHGEKSPSYLINRDVPPRVKSTLPEAKFIVLLRDPIERALSQYSLRRKLSNVKVSFDEFDWNEGYMLQRGHYAEQLEHWFSYFPRNRFLILRSEDFFRDTQREMDKVWEFLGLEKAHPGRYERYGESEKVCASEESIQKLVEYYVPHRDKLERLLGWTV